MIKRKVQMMNHRDLDHNAEKKKSRYMEEVIEIMD